MVQYSDDCGSQLCLAGLILTKLGLEVEWQTSHIITEYH